MSAYGKERGSEGASTASSGDAGEKVAADRPAMTGMLAQAGARLGSGFLMRKLARRRNERQEKEGSGHEGEQDHSGDPEQSANNAHRPADQPLRVGELTADMLDAVNSAREEVEQPPAPQQADPKKKPGDKPTATGPAPADKDGPTGIASAISINRFAGEARKIQKEWPALTDDKRAQRLAQAGNHELQAASVPPYDVGLKDLPAGNGGHFDFKPWTMEMRKGDFAVPSVTDDTALRIATNVYHETRHAEQWHRMARLLAGQGKTAAGIQSETMIKADVVADAVKKPLDAGGKEGREAQGFYDSVYGKNRAARNATLTKLLAQLVTLNAAEKANDQVAHDRKASPAAKDAASKAWKVASDAFQSTYKDYRALPEEADAFKAGDAAGAALKKKK